MIIIINDSNFILLLSCTSNNYDNVYQHVMFTNLINCKSYDCFVWFKSNDIVRGSQVNSIAESFRNSEKWTRGFPVTRSSAS